jgi:hypothetical protein
MVAQIHGEDPRNRRQTAGDGAEIFRGPEQAMQKDDVRAVPGDDGV